MVLLGLYQGRLRPCQGQLETQLEAFAELWIGSRVKKVPDMCIVKQEISVFADKKSSQCIRKMQQIFTNIYRNTNKKEETSEDDGKDDRRTRSWG